VRPRTVKDLGEFGLIRRITGRLPASASVIVGPGDDCAVLPFDRKRYQLLTCDMIVEGVDFTRHQDPRLIGRKALAVCVSDIAACAGAPRYAVVTLGLRPDTRVSTVDGIARGLAAAARQFKVAVVGGDISRAAQLSISVSMTGVVDKRRLLVRSGAKSGDFILVGGKLGDSIKGKHLTFVPRLRQAQYLAANFKVNAMIDISDGLVQDLGHILERSRAGALVYTDLVPRRFSTTSLENALYGGEDFELLFTMPGDEARRLLKKRRGEFYPIGQITGRKDGLRLVERCRVTRAPSTRGYTHF
jgi:thiamine-monophosphate kinase